MNTSNEQQFSIRMNAFLSSHQVLAKYKLLYQPDLRNYSLNSHLPLVKPDFLIMNGEFPFIIVDVVGRNSLRMNFEINQYTERYLLTLDVLGAHYFIVTDNSKMYILERKKAEVSTQAFEKIFNLFDDYDENEINSLTTEIGKIISEVVIKELLTSEKTTLKKYRDIRDIFSRNLGGEITYNRDGRFFHFAISAEDELGSFENLFFQHLLEEVDDQVVCRYTTLDSLFHMIKGRSFRMGSHLAMNDRGEIDYFDKYIGTFYKPIVGLSLSEMKKINNSYISSCTENNKEDDLTMYRLYGDDSKGVCLTFNVTKGVQRSNMLIRKISYGTARNNHPELDLIKSILDSISSRLSLTFRFIYLDIWKHFFKSFDYRLENEVRLLFIKTTTSTLSEEGWVITNPDRIISKYVMFELNGKDFPLKLAKILLGPNVPEKQLNKKQIEVMLDEKGLGSINVELSEIESYRKI